MTASAAVRLGALSLLVCSVASCAPRVPGAPARTRLPRLAAAGRPAATSWQVTDAGRRRVTPTGDLLDQAIDEALVVAPSAIADASAPEHEATAPPAATDVAVAVLAGTAPASIPAAAQPLAAEVGEPGAVAGALRAAETLGWPRLAVFELALQAYRCGDQEGRFRRPVLTIIDYSLPATEKRLWVIDLSEGRVLHHELVAHGEQSGDNVAVAFSNRVDSHQTSLGLFRTDDIYSGQYGYALRLSGLEPGFNDNARARAIVFHGSPDVSPVFAAQWGTIGRSWGCPALPEESAAQVIDCIAGGSAVFAYYPDAEWLQNSRYLHCAAPLAEGVAVATD